MWNKIFCTEFLRNRTVVLVTQLPWLPAKADLTITLGSGSVESLALNAGPRTALPITSGTGEGAEMRNERRSDAIAQSDEEEEEGNGGEERQQETDIDEEVAFSSLFGRLSCKPVVTSTSSRLLLTHTSTYLISVHRL